MVKIRLARGGAKKKPYYRIVVADVRKKRDGKSIILLPSHSSSFLQFPSILSLIL